MQPQFEAMYDVLPQVLSEIERAKKDKIGIVVLQYDGNGDTTLTIRRALKDYRRKTYARKYNDDGSIEFVRAAIRKKFSIANVRVVGVNRGYCVRDTVAGLMDCGKINTIDVIVDATSGRSPEYEINSLDDIADRSSGMVRLV